MISDNKLTEAFNKFCQENGLTYGDIKLEEYRIDNHFFKTNETVWVALNDNGDCACINEDKLEAPYQDMFKHDYPSVPEELEISQELYELLDSGCYIFEDSDWAIEGILLESLEGKVYGDLPEEMQADVNSWWDEITLDDVRDHEFILSALEISDIDEKYGFGALMETLGYFTVYYQSIAEDVDAALKAGLQPFWYDGVFMLALGGCGQDLSPMLDTYQALVAGTLSSDSKALNDVKYFDYTSPMKAQEVLEMCRLPEPKLTFTAYIRSKYIATFRTFAVIEATSEGEAYTMFDAIIASVPNLGVTNISIRDAVISNTSRRYYIDFMGNLPIELDPEVLSVDSVENAASAKIKSIILCIPEILSIEDIKLIR